jgi:CDP-diacylglycerol--glycerol-3-phosphate 3-phosphatidyltransferase
MIWTLPNVLTGLRLVAVPGVGMVLVLAGDSPAGRWTALALFAVASLTDVADGWLARRWDQCTDFGALADPIADKALVGTVLVCLSWQGAVPWWATSTVLAREVAVTVLRFTVLRHGVIPASRGGKAKTVMQTALVVLALAAPGSSGVIMAVALVTVLWTVLTGLDYAVKAVVLARPAGPPSARPAGPPPARTAMVSVPHADGPRPLFADDARQQGGAGASARLRS